MVNTSQIRLQIGALSFCMAGSIPSHGLRADSDNGWDGLARPDPHANRVGGVWPGPEWAQYVGDGMTHVGQGKLESVLSTQRYPCPGYHQSRRQLITDSQDLDATVAVSTGWADRSQVFVLRLRVGNKVLPRTTRLGIFTLPYAARSAQGQIGDPSLARSTARIFLLAESGHAKLAFL